ncbi:hypothetical protein [Haloplanus sp. C73]|uniref:hypothetical protein n=1 Tax=Haloplanus sp. C73 TaxID=3421641 RepID=UPI003EBAB48F
MQRRAYLRTLGTLSAVSALAGCSADDEARAATSTPAASETPDPTATTTPTPTQRALAPYRSWLVAPTPVEGSLYEFTHLSLSAVRRDATPSFAESLNTFWRQRTEAYFGVSVPVDSLDAVLTVSHSRDPDESYRVASGSFDRDVLRPRLADAGFSADGFVGDVQRFVRASDGVQRVIGLHPDLLVSIGALTSATDPLATALDQHAAGEVRTESNAGTEALVDYFGTADYVTGQELEPADETYTLSTAVATGRRLDVGETTSWAERAYVLPPDATIDRAVFEEEIQTRHAGQPTDEFRREGRVVAVAGEVENSLVRLV